MNMPSRLPTQPGLRKYMLGLAVLFIFVLVLLVLVVSKAGDVKADAATYKAASAAATKLDDYISNKQKIPASLSEAGVKNVPDSIEYTKIDSTKYKFCATYKQDATGFDSSTVTTNLLTATTGTDYSSPSSQTENSYLYLTNTYHSGKNCQTITPYIYNGGGGGCAYPLDNGSSAYDEYYRCLQQSDSSNSSDLYNYDSTTQTYTN